MSFIWLNIFALALLWSLAMAQHDLELDYSNEYDNVRPHMQYPDEPRLDKRISAAAQEFGESIRNAWQSMADSLHNYFEEVRNIFADGVNNNNAE